MPGEVLPGPAHTLRIALSEQYVAGAIPLATVPATFVRLQVRTLVGFSKSPEQGNRYNYSAWEDVPVEVV